MRDLSAVEADDDFIVEELAAFGREYALLRITWSDGRVEYEEFIAGTELAEALHEVSIAALDLTGYDVTLAGMNARGQEVIEYGQPVS
jgi:hypothetical protein